MASNEQPWRLGISNTRKGIYLIRYLLFAGGLAIAGALIHRARIGTEHPLAGFLLGLGAGLFLFRGQLRSFSWPNLLLTRESLILVARKRTVVLEWSMIRNVTTEGRRVTLALAARVEGLQGEPVEHLGLDASELGTSSSELAQLIGGLASAPERRSKLPSEAQARI